jgi:hypothetical protein
MISTLTAVGLAAGVSPMTEHARSSFNTAPLAGTFATSASEERS